MSSSPPTQSRTATASSRVAAILGLGPEESFDRLTRIATLALRTPIAVISLITDGRLLLKSHVGLPEPWASDRDVPLPHAIFRHAVATSKPFVVGDSARHPLTRDMFLGDEWTHAAYCGIPLIVEDRRVVGVLSVIDREPRQWTQREIGFLQDLAASAAEEVSGRLWPAPAPAPPVPEPPRETPDPRLAVDRDFNVRAANPAAVAILGRPADELVGSRLLEMFPSLPDSEFHAHWLSALARGTIVEYEGHCTTLGLWLETRAYPSADGLAIELRDVSARRNAEDALRQSEARYRSVFQESRDPIFFTTPDGTLVECNRSAIDLLGHSREELFRQRFPDLIADSESRDALRKELAAKGRVDEFEAQLRTSSGDRLDTLIAIVPRHAPESEGGGYRITVRDNTEQKQLARQLLRNAFQDPLTGLANRAVFLDRLERLYMQAQRRPGYRFAVLFIDLDRFKPVNDTFGHIAGDELLSTVARRLEACLRQEDSVSRFGGDEFAILLDGVQDVRDATRIADRINSELGLPIRIGHREVACSASIGIAISAPTHERAEQVLSDADAAMYRAKAVGGGGYELFDTEMQTRALAQLQLESDLQRAVRENEFLLHYQPVLSVEGGFIAGFEALLRWRHPERGLLHPVDFVTTAEQTGVIADIGWLMLERVCARVREWKDVAASSTFDLGVGVNLSPRLFNHPDLIRHVDAALNRTGVEGRYLRLEVTEDALMEDTEFAAERLASLRERGVTVAVDHFGTGFTSLRYLQQLPIAVLKIDRSFLRSLERDPYNRGVVESIVALGRCMDIDVIALGVESLEQLTELRRMGTRYAQGYLFSEPLDDESATELVLERLRT